MSIEHLLVNALLSAGKSALTYVKRDAVRKDGSRGTRVQVHNVKHFTLNHGGFLHTFALTHVLKRFNSKLLQSYARMLHERHVFYNLKKSYSLFLFFFQVLGEYI